MGDTKYSRKDLQPLSVNRWPGGSKMVVCLGVRGDDEPCNKVFKSLSKVNRICPACKRVGYDALRTRRPAPSLLNAFSGEAL